MERIVEWPGLGFLLGSLQPGPPPLSRDAVEIVAGVQRNRALELFARFFQQYGYWQESLLALVYPGTRPVR